MRNTRKILVALLVLMTILVSLVAVAIPASAAKISGGTKLYLVPNTNWNTDNARFAAYFFGDGDVWVSMTKVAGESNLYEVTVPAGKNFSNVIFCRMNPSASANNWNNKWNQTGDLVFDSVKDVYTINAGSWDKGTWSHRTHAFSEATCKAPATCACGETTGTKLDHQFVEGKCTVCGDSDPNYCAHLTTTKINTAKCTVAGELYDLCDSCSEKLNVETAPALGHDMGFNNKCTREGCDYGTSYTIAGTGAHLGTEWDTGNTANDMTYDPETSVYTKVYENVAAGTYKFKCAQNHDWGTAYPSADKSYTVATAGSTVTITLKGTTVNVTVEAPHTHSWSDASCTEPQKCSCGETQGEALGHRIENYIELAPTCTTPGYSAHQECVREGCDYTTFYVETAPKGHTWTEATCEAAKTCETCGATEGEALGHTPGAEPTCTVAQTCTVCGVELAPTLPHVDTDLDITCDYEGCTKRILPPADSKVSLFTANCMIIMSLSNDYYVEGVVTEVLDAKNGGFVITDDAGDQLYIRMPVDADGVSHANWQVKVVVGDVVSVYGKPKSTSGWNTTLKAGMQGGVLTFIEQHAHVAAGDPVCTKDTLCVCGAVVAPATGHIDADNNGMCDSCNWDMNLVEVNIAIGTDPKYNGVRVDDEAGEALSWTWSNGGFDAIFTKGTSTFTLYTTAKDYMQLKKQNLLTVVNTADVTVKYVVISVTNATYLGHLKTALTNSGYEFTADEANFTATIQLNSTEDFVLENKASSTIYVNGVTIVYAKKGAHVHDFKETITTPATCTTEGVKTFTCECGEGTYTEAIEALGHDFVKGVCTRCEEADPNYVPPCEHKDTGLDAKCDICGEYFLPESPFKLEMYQASKKETYYFTGSMSGYYFASSTDITEAVDLYAEEVDGGYNVYFMSGSTKNYLYIELSGTHINAKFGSTKAVWYVDPTYGCLTTEVSGAKYFLGTYSDYVTFGGTAYSRLNDSTADVSQYIGRAVSLENHVCEKSSSTVTAPKCEAEGYTTYKCNLCGQSTKADYVDALGHDMITDKAVAPTCTATGLTEGSHCSRCDYKVAQEEVPALGHTAGAEATCTAAQTCTVCNTELVAALGHTAGAEATCEAAQTCTVCNAELVAALGHDMMTHTETLPTCTETGLTAGAECSRCDHKTGLEEIPALGHDYAEGQCTRCGEKDPDYVAPHEHNFVEGKCECGETDPDYKPEEKPEDKPDDETPEEEPKDENPVVELTLMEKIMKAINELIAQLTAWLNGLLAGLKK